MPVWNAAPPPLAWQRTSGGTDAHHQDRGPALQCRLARFLVPQDQHRRRHRRLVGIHRSYGSAGLGGVIRKLSEMLIGRDPRAVEKITAYLHGVTRQSVGGIAHQAIAAIENALVDLKAKALGIPVYEMLGGPIRDRLQLYWSHCGTWRIATRPDQGVDRVRPDALAGRRGEAGAEVAERGFKGLKTNIFRFDGPRPEHAHARLQRPGWPELNISADLVDGLVATGWRRSATGAGPDVGLHLDPNFNFKTEGYIKVARRHCEPYNLLWLEIDSYDPGGAAPDPRRRARCRSRPANRCSAAASSGRSSRTDRSTCRSSTCRGMASWS